MFIDFLDLLNDLGFFDNRYFTYQTKHQKKTSWRPNPEVMSMSQPMRTRSHLKVAIIAKNDLEESVAEGAEGIITEGFFQISFQLWLYDRYGWLSFR